jgi:hypothetical protein
MLQAIAYDETDNTLCVTFGNGGKYAYKDVPRNVFEELIAAESEGEYLLSKIKGKYEFEKC